MVGLVRAPSGLWLTGVLVLGDALDCGVRCPASALGDGTLLRAHTLLGAPAFCLWLAQSGKDESIPVAESGSLAPPGGSRLVIEALRAGTNPGGPVSCP